MRCEKAAKSARLFKLSSFFVGQRDNNAITNATNELKGVLFLAGDVVHVMLQRGNYVDRLVLASPVHRHSFIVVLFAEYALDRLFVHFTCTHVALFRLSVLAGEAHLW